LKTAYQSIVPLQQRKSTLTDVKLFHEAINVTFHNIEAKYYDRLHRDMWNDLRAPLELLVADLLADGGWLPGSVRLLDIGCGTGLATELLLGTCLGTQITEITMLDTSSEMLQYAAGRAGKWGRETFFHEGGIESLPQQDFGLVMISSVLHHIPDLTAFMQTVGEKLKDGGILITIHDPLSEAIAGPCYQQRAAAYRLDRTAKRASFFPRLYFGLKRRIKARRTPDFIAEINTALLQKGVIHTPMTEVELWSVTDINVEDLPYAQQAGISIQWLAAQMTTFRRISFRTYGFFGRMPGDLDRTYRREEFRLYSEGDLNGRNFGSVWKKITDRTQMIIP
jgi:SAM-dependent methyltransferase